MENRDFTIVESKEEIKELEKELKHYLPFSVSVFNTLHMILKGSLDLVPILVNRQRGKPTICLIKQGSGEYPEYYFITMYCPEERKTDLVLLLKNTTLIQWQPCVKFIFLQDTFEPSIAEVCQEIGLEKVKAMHGVDRTKPAPLLVFPEKSLVDSSKSLPSGYRFGLLRPEDFIKIHESLPYKKEVPFDYFQRTYMRTKNAAIFYGADNEMVAWAVQDRYGQIGKLHTMPQHRNKGLGAFLLQKMKEHCILDGFIPYTVSETALDYLLNRGFHVAFNTFFLWLASPELLKRHGQQ